MARIIDKNDQTVLKIRAFLGLNENPDGSTTLKVGEMSEMRNFRITQDNHLQVRPGSKLLWWIRPGNDAGLYGANVVTVNKEKHLFVLHRQWFQGNWVASISAFTFAEDDPSYYQVYGLGVINEPYDVKCGTFFGFDGKVYLLTGENYYVWDGDYSHSFAEVSGYVPLVQTATSPAGVGTLLETVNKLTPKRRVQFSPDGTSTTFYLPEKNINAVTKVSVNGIVIQSGYDWSLADGTVSFSTAPDQGTNTVEIEYEKGIGGRTDVAHMRYCEFYNGTTDTRVFLYGDGSNRTVYSGINGDTGKPSAEYFPDLYEMAVGESNTEITSLTRHYNRLMVYKRGSTWSIQYSDTTLPDGSVIPAFYCQPVNRQIGNDAPGQSVLLENNPVTMDADRLYQWRSGTSYGATIVNSENNAKRISDRIGITLKSFDAERTRMFNIKSQNELWFVCDHRALILNYAADAWYYYDNLPLNYVFEINNEVYGIGYENLQSGQSGNIAVTHISREYRCDLFRGYSEQMKEIDCYAATGAMDFDRDWLLKYSPMVFVAMQPETNSRITVTVETDRRSDYPEKTVAYNLATFSHVDFGHFSFGTNRKPQVKRLKMKVKKATFYRLIFKSFSASATATILETDVMLRYAGKIK